MNNSIEISKASAADIESVARLFCDYRTFYTGKVEFQVSLDFISKRLENNDSHIFIAWAKENDQTIATGFVQLYPTFSSVSAKDTLVLNDLYVAAEYRQSGIARALMNTAEQFAKQQGANGLSLCTAKDNHKAQALYDSLGYELDNDFLHYFLAV